MGTFRTLAGPVKVLVQVVGSQLRLVYFYLGVDKLSHFFLVTNRSLEIS